jgi:sigma-E factor negative regulatory protein RseB
MMGGKLFFLALLLSTATFSFTAADSKGTSAFQAKSVLKKMSNAMKVLNFQGTVVFLRNGKLETMKYFHAAKNGAQQERLVALNSPLREIIREAHTVSCHFKAAKQTVIDYRPFERSFLVDLPDNLEQLDNVYQFDMVGEENIAMLPAYVVTIYPKDNLRYVRKIWIEKNYFLPLKIAVFDLAGQVLEQTVFADLQVKDSISFVSSPLAVRPEEQDQESFQDEARTFSGFKVEKMPAGFYEVFFTRTLMHNLGQPVDHMVLSDGFSTVSIYMENKNAFFEQGLHTIGAVNSYGRSMGEFELTVMGEVPATTVKFIADQITVSEHLH